MSLSDFRPQVILGTSEPELTILQQTLAFLYGETISRAWVGSSLGKYTGESTDCCTASPYGGWWGENPADRDWRDCPKSSATAAGLC
ncbi:hypothetical protein EBY67_07240 [bacterium]|nr:hypothetical protein [bacterium]